VSHPTSQPDFRRSPGRPRPAPAHPRQGRNPGEHVAQIVPRSSPGLLCKSLRVNAGRIFRRCVKGIPLAALAHSGPGGPPGGLRPLGLPGGRAPGGSGLSGPPSARQGHPRAGSGGRPSGRGSARGCGPGGASEPGGAPLSAIRTGRRGCGAARVAAGAS
jgi:hypothetical protein